MGGGGGRGRGRKPGQSPGPATLLAHRVGEDPSAEDSLALSFISSVSPSGVMCCDAVTHAT